MSDAMTAQVTQTAPLKVTIADGAHQPLPAECVTAYTPTLGDQVAVIRLDSDGGSASRSRLLVLGSF